MSRFIFDRRFPMTPRIRNNISEIFQRARRLYHSHKNNLYPYVVTPSNQEAVNPIMLIGNCGTNDPLLADLCWLTDARDDALQDLLAAIYQIDRKGVSRARMQALYDHWGYIHQLDNANSIFVGALIDRANMSAGDEKEST